MKKYNVLTLGTAALLLMNPLQVKAAPERIWEFKKGGDTYVSNDHDGYWNDTYIGVASVRGTEMRPTVDNRLEWPKWTKITYNVQGEYHSATATAYSNDDDVVRTRSVTAKDKWNFGDKTKVLYNYETYVVHGPLVP